MLKKSMDILDLYVWIHQYGKRLTDCRVSNIYRSTTYWLFKIRCPGLGKQLLKVEPSRRIHLSIYEPGEKGVDRVSAFLRRRIRNGFLRDLSMLGWERIVKLAFEKELRLNMYVEIIPRGFLVITDEENKIIFADRYATLRDRVIKRGERYMPPPGGSNIIESSDHDLVEEIKKGKDLVRGLVKGWGLPGYLAEEILYRAGLYHLKNVRPTDIEEHELNTIAATLKDLVKESKEGHGYIVVRDEPVFVSPYRPNILLEQVLPDATLKITNDFNEALDIYFSNYEKKVIGELKSRENVKVIEGLRKSLEQQERIIEKYRRELESAEKILQLMYEKHEELSRILECIQRIRKTKGWDAVPKTCGVVRIEKEHGRVYVKVGDELIPLNVRLDIWGNAGELRKKIGVLRGKIKKAYESREELIRRMNKLEKQARATEKRVTSTIKPKPWYEKYHWLITSNGFLVIGGRDAGQNETLVRRYLEPHDIFLHADIHGGPATIIKTRGRKPPEQDMAEAAVIAGCYSRAWREGLGAIDVYWVYGSQVSKTPPSGEYLARGAFMVYGKKNYLRVEMRLALGIELVCDPIYGAYQRIISGPAELVAKRSLVYAILLPGDKRPVDVSRVLHNLFRKRLEPQYLVGIEREEIEYRVPGPSRITGIDRGELYGETCG